jgi:hypothetical protein
MALSSQNRPVAAQQSLAMGFLSVIGSQLVESPEIADKNLRSTMISLDLVVSIRDNSKDNCFLENPS